MSDSSSPGARPLLIVGCSRSGTSWLARMLADLPRVYNLGEASWGAQSADWVRGTLNAYDARAVVIDKTPANVYHLDRLIRDLPTLRAILMVRDPRSVVASMMDATAWARTTPGFSVRRAGQLWSRAMEEAERAAQWMGRRMVVVRYETLHRQTADEVARICSVVGIQSDRSRIEKSVAAASFQRLAQTVETGPGRFHHLGETDSWRRSLNADEIREIENVVGPRLARYGYQSSAVGG